MSNIEIINSKQLYAFLKTVLPYHSFELYMHILTDPYLSLLISLPKVVRGSSQIYLDGEKDKINSYAARKLWSAGYTVYFARRLHGKVIVVGSRPDYIVIGTSNLSERSFLNYEAIVVIKHPSKSLVKSLRDYFILPVKKASYIPHL